MDPIMNPMSLQTSALQYQGQAQASQLGQLQKQGASKDDQKLRQAARDFEAIFVNQMLEAMDKTIDRENSVLSGGSSEHYFRSMMNEEIAKSMTNRTGGSGFGLAEAVYRQMAKQVQPSQTAETAKEIQGSGKRGEVKP